MATKPVKKAPAKKTSAKKKAPTLVAFGGTKSVKKALINKALDAAIERIGGEVKFLLPGSKELFTDTAQLVHAYALAHDIEYDIVCDPDGLKARVNNLGPARKGAAKVHSVKRSVGDKIGALLTAAGENGALLIACVEDDEDAEVELEKTLQKIAEAGTLCLDVSDGGAAKVDNPFAEEEPGGEDDEDDEPEDDEEEAEDDDADEESEEAEDDEEDDDTDEDEDGDDDESDDDADEESDDEDAGDDAVEASGADLAAVANAILIAQAEALEAAAKALRKAATE